MVWFGAVKSMPMFGCLSEFESASYHSKN